MALIVTNQICQPVKYVIRVVLNVTILAIMIVHNVVPILLSTQPPKNVFAILDIMKITQVVISAKSVITNVSLAQVQAQANVLHANPILML